MTELLSRPMELPTTAEWKVLVVDDDEDVHTVTNLAIRRMHFNGRPVRLLHAHSSAEALALLLANEDVAVALIDVVMETDTAGLDLVRQVREELGNDRLRIVLRTGNPGKAPEERVTFDYDINDYREKTELTAQGLRTVVVTGMRSYESLMTIRRLNRDLDETQQELILSLSEIAESRSRNTGHHVRRVGRISGCIAGKMGYAEEQSKRMCLAAFMHDIGKLTVPDEILNKPDLLTEAEMTRMRTHCEMGAAMLASSNREMLQLAARMALEHHEWFDGSGYPKGLRGAEISLESRIVAVVDVFDALATKRPYKDIWPQDLILAYLRERRGTQFDPDVLDVFFANLDEIRHLIADLPEM